MALPEIPGHATIPSRWPLATVVTLALVIGGSVVRSEMSNEALWSEIAEQKAIIAAMKEQRARDNELLAELRSDVRLILAALARMEKGAPGN